MMPDKFYHDQPSLPWQRNLGQNSITRYPRDIPEIFAYNRVFRRRSIEWRQTNSTATNPRCSYAWGSYGRPMRSPI